MGHRGGHRVLHQLRLHPHYLHHPGGSMGGAATVIIQGLGIGMLSCVPPVVIIVITIIACYSLGGVYGISMAAVGMLSTLGITLATDAYGPVADNAGGIAEMTPGVGEEVH